MMFFRLAKSIFFTICISNLVFFSALSPSLSYATTAEMDADEFARAAVRKMRVVILKGSQVKFLVGKEFKNYSLMKFIDERLEAMPFQFDDMSELGQPYTGSKGAAVKGSIGIFDENDELLFMFKDGRDKASQLALDNVEGRVVAELAVSDNGRTHYFYLVEGNAQRSDVDYIEYDPESYLIKSDRWSMQTDPENPIVWGDFFYHSFQEKHSLLDTMKMRIGGKVGFVSLVLNNNNVIGNTLGFKDGPIRDFLEMNASVVLLGVPFMSIKMGFLVTQHNLGAPAYVDMPVIAKAIKNPLIQISLDAHQLQGALSRTALGPVEPAIANGEVSKQEKTMAVDADNTWLALSSQKGFDIMATFEHSENFDVDLGVLYKEGEEDKPERYKGSDPQLGYYISNLPLGDPFFFQISLFFLDNLWGDNHPELFAKYLAKEPVATISQLE